MLHKFLFQFTLRFRKSFLYLYSTIYIIFLISISKIIYYVQFNLVHVPRIPTVYHKSQSEFDFQGPTTTSIFLSVVEILECLEKNCHIEFEMCINTGATICSEPFKQSLFIHQKNSFKKHQFISKFSKQITYNKIKNIGFNKV